MEYDRDKMMADLLQSQQDSFQRKEAEGLQKWRGLFIDPTPSDMVLWKVAEGKHCLDVVPYACGDHQPVSPGNPPKKPSSWCHTLEFWVHDKLGPMEQRRICMLRTWGPPFKCPICDWLSIERQKDTPNQKQIETYVPKRRNMYNIWLHDNAEAEAKGILQWEASWHSFEKIVQGRAVIPFGGGVIPWMSASAQGKRIYFEREGKTLINTKYVNHQFLDRPTEIPTPILEKALVLDRLMAWPEFEDVYEVFYQEKYKAGGPLPKLADIVAAPNTTYSFPPASTEAGQTMPSPATISPPAFAPVFPEPTPTPAPAAGKEMECPSGGMFGLDFKKLPGGVCDYCKIGVHCFAEYKKSTPDEPLIKAPEPTPQPSAAPEPTPSAGTSTLRRRRLVR
jgi:hypothetical protein